MKKVILFSIALLAGFLSGTAQYNMLPQKYLDFEYPKLTRLNITKSVNDWWEPDTVCFISPNFETGEMEVKIKNIFEYNLQGLLIEFSEQWFINNSWRNSLLKSFSYDSNDNKLTELHQDWRNNSWENFRLITYVYDSNNNLINRLEQNWENNSWGNFALITYTYDSNDNMINLLNQSWRNNSWEFSSQRIYTYDSNNNLLTSIFKILYTKLTTYTYDSNNNIINILEQEWQDNSWENITQTTRTFDSANNILTELHQHWDNNSWNFSYQYIFTYDSNNNMLTKSYQIMSNNSWENKTQTTYTYNSSNNTLTETMQKWENNSWENDKQYLMIYDENGNGISVESLIWIDDSWQLTHHGMHSYPTLLLYYNNMQSTIEGFGDKTTASYKKVRSTDTGIKDIKTESPFKIHSSGKTIHINNKTGKNAEVSVYGITGQKVAEQTMSDRTTTIEIPVSGFYLVSVKAGNEKPVTAKVIIR